MLKIINISAVIAVVFIVLFSVVDFRHKAEYVEKPKGHMEDVIPKTLTGWTSEEVPIATTEEVARATEKILNSSQYISRKYVSENGGREFNMFINYWGKGLEDPQKASTHVPDRCWVKNGWTNHKDKAVGDYKIAVDGVNVFPANYRELSISANGMEYRRYACFWHLLDYEPYNYNPKDAAMPRLDVYISTMLKSALNGAPEQYFVRIDAPFPIEELFGDEGFKELMLALQKLALENVDRAEK